MEVTRAGAAPSHKLLIALVLTLSFLWLTVGASPIEERNGRRIVAVGDVHGDLAQLRAVLQMAAVIDEEGSWIDKEGTTVVQVGDLLDRGPHDRAVMDFVMQLQKEAEMAGGRVVNLIGNHELMNLQAQFHYVHPESHEFFDGKQNRRRLFDSQGTYGGWLRKNPLVHVEGSSLFVHAGLPPQFAAMGIDRLNREAAEILATPKLEKTDLRKNEIFGVNGPIWTRLLITDAMNGRCGDVEKSLALLPGVKRMIVGHTPQRSGRIETYCDEQLIAVDVGMSKWMYGHLAALEITTTNAADGSVELREIVPNTVVDESASSTSKSSSKTQVTQQGSETTKTQSGSAATPPASVDEAVQDPLLLQELLEAIQELKGRQAQGQQQDASSSPRDEF